MGKCTSESRGDFGKMRRALWNVSLIVMLLSILLSGYAYDRFSEGFPMHYNLEGEYSSVEPVWVVWFYPLSICMAGGVIFVLDKCLGRFISRKAVRRVYAPFAALCLSIFITLSLLVGISGGCHLFMFAEPVVLLSFLVIFAFCEYKIKL